MFKVEFSFNSLPELQEFLDRPSKPIPEKTPAKTAEKAPEKSAPENKAAKATKGPKPEPIPEDKVTVPHFIGKKEAPAVTYSQIVEAVNKAGEMQLRPQVIEIFQRFGVPTGKQLTEEQWAPCLQQLQELIANTEQALA